MTTVRYFAAAKAAAGRASEQVEARTLAELVAQLGAEHGPELARVLTICSFLVDGTPAGERDPADLVVAESLVVDVLPPFAGG